MFSVDLFGQSKASTLEQENQKLKNELLDTESKVSLMIKKKKNSFINKHLLLFFLDISINFNSENPL
mgnify:CR=1 FL=1